MQIQTFSEYLSQTENISGRLEITEVLANLYKNLQSDEIKIANYLLQGSLVPNYEPLEFQLSTKMVVRALAHFIEIKLTNEGDSAVDSALKEVESYYKKTGDLGETAFFVCSQIKATHSLDVNQVYRALTDIAKENGQGSQQRKLEKLRELLKQVDPLSAKFITRIIIGKLRLGFSTMTMIDALSWAVTGGKAHRKILEEAYQKQADIGSLAEYYLTHINSNDDLASATQKLEKEYTVVAGIPVVPALCQRLNSAAEIIDKMSEVYAEPKYDGLRVQIHFTRKLVESESGKSRDSVTQLPTHLVKVFTRNLEEVTEMFPEVQKLGECIHADSVIFDGEAIGYDPKTDTLLPFQQTMNRKRKHDIETVAQSIPLKFFLYDILSIDEEQLINQPLTKRKKKLETILKKNATFVSAPYIVTDNADKLRSFHEKQLEDGLEGVVVKQLTSSYQSGRKGWAWVKIKEAEGTSGKLSDTVDAVVMGYYSGRGTRTKFGLGAILVGVSNGDETEMQFLTVTKVGTGITEAQLAEIKTILAPYEVKEQPRQYSVHKNLIPDVWVEPKIVLEIAADEITKSPTHTAGWALRFPRLVKIRADKDAAQATSLKELNSIHIA